MELLRAKPDIQPQHGAGGEGIVKTAVATFGRVDILVNNAGILRDKSFVNMDEVAWDEVVAVHLKGTFLCSQAFARRVRMQGGGGRIVNTTSVSGMFGNFGLLNDWQPILSALLPLSVFSAAALIALWRVESR
ncbi:MAG: SDR family NAD(P)-dependent oxidoreductase [Thiobacillus sp.]|nr:SDR family NAD(P)-dependent oxidoreductase [Thiobacillus sp.]